MTPNQPGFSSGRNANFRQGRNVSPGQSRAVPPCPPPPPSSTFNSSASQPLRETACPSLPSCAEPAPPVRQERTEVSPAAALLRPSGQPSQRQLFQRVTLTGFAALDASLYLDTHPSDSDALQYFIEHITVYNQAVEAYSRLFGPLTIAHAHHNDNYWDWVNQPWPWE